MEETHLLLAYCVVIAEKVDRAKELGEIYIKVDKTVAKEVALALKERLVNELGGQKK